MLRITSAQINPTIGDITGNIALMLRAARQARIGAADLVVFPEMSLTAYYPADLLDDANFQARLKAGLAQLLLAMRETPQLYWVVGTRMRCSGIGKPFYNALRVLNDGEVVLQYSEQLMPTYNIFDERRHFEPGPDVARVLRVLRVGDVQYDGASFAVNAQGAVVYLATRFSEDVTTLCFDPATQPFAQRDGADLPVVPQTGLPTMEFYRQQIVLGFKDYARRCVFTQAVVGSYGGIDSALTVALAAEALGADNVVDITMSSKFSSEGSVSDSVALCHNLGIRLIEHPIKAIVSAFEATYAASFGEALQGLPLESLQARVRGTTLMEYSNPFRQIERTAPCKKPYPLRPQQAPRSSSAAGNCSTKAMRPC